MTDIKAMYFLNTTALLACFAEIETFLKITLLLLTIGYTINRWLILRKKNNNEDN